MAIELQSFDKVEKQEFEWGWVRWLMSDKLSPGSPQTIGIVQINPGHSNPMHTHPNCEEALYVTAGVCEHVRGDETVKMNVGDMIRIPTGVPHCARCAGDEPMQAFIVFNNGKREAAPV